MKQIYDAFSSLEFTLRLQSFSVVNEAYFILHTAVESNFLFKNSNSQFLKKSNFTHFLPIFMGLKILLEKKVTPKSGFVVFNIHLLVDKRDIWPMHKSLLQKNWADDQPSRFPSKNQLTHSFNHHLEQFYRVSKQTQHWIFMTKLNFCSVLVL